jgi:phosphoenolpyruvate synthase/pyruvate phosphate dikinase
VTRKRSCVVRWGLAGKAGNAARWLATLQITLFHYLQAKILADDPFQVLDQDGVGELVEMGVIRGRQTKPGLKIGICGEHGGEPKSIAFCHRLEMDYVSCSPFRVPIARLAAAQAMIGRTIRELIS